MHHLVTISFVLVFLVLFLLYLSKSRLITDVEVPMRCQKRPKRSKKQAINQHLDDVMDFNCKINLDSAPAIDSVDKINEILARNDGRLIINGNYRITDIYNLT